MNDVVAYGSCCECGSCVLVCPHNVIEYVDGKPKQTAKASADFDYCGISEGIGCDVCAQVCPRLGPREFEIAEDFFGSQRGRVLAGGFGYYRRIFVARVRDEGLRDACQDGGVVTALLIWALESGLIDGAVVAAADPSQPCAAVPLCATSREEILAAAGSWYTYCPNDLALEEAESKGCERIAFVGVPCQITPLRKAELRAEDFLDNGRKKPKHIERQRASLKGPSARIALSVGLLCSEVFDFQGLMIDHIQGELGIALEDICKFNVKGKVLIYPRDGEVVEMPLAEAQKFARPECEHCGDFSAEVADISCGGVGAMDWTVTIVRSERGERMMDAMLAAGLLELRPIEEFEASMKTLLRLARRQHQRVPEGRSGAAAVRPPHFRPRAS